MPLSRKAAVLILLYANETGELNVVVTMRASTLSSYSGQAALPGGKAEAGESAFECARREAEEEIGLSQHRALPPPFKVEHLCEMPTNLAKTYVSYAMHQGSNQAIVLVALSSSTPNPTFGVQQVQFLTAP